MHAETKIPEQRISTDPGKSTSRPVFCWLLLSAALLIITTVGVRLSMRAHNSYDFLPVYTGARCLLHSCDPYKTSDLQAQYLAAGGKIAEMNGWYAYPPVYPPSTLVVLAPLGLLNWTEARIVWELGNAALLAVAAFLILSECGAKFQFFSVALLIALLFTEISLFQSGQPARFAISTLAIAVIFFYRSRFLPLASILLMLSLAVKPQLAGLPLLFLLFERKHLRYTISSAVGALILLLAGSGILTTTIGSEWPHELSLNISNSFLPGQINDLRTQSGNEVNLQGLTQVLFASDTVAKAASTLISLLLLGVWFTLYLRRSKHGTDFYLALGTLVVLSLLVVYHRFYDTAILVLAVPAIVGLYRRRRSVGLNAAALIFLACVSLSQNVDAWSHTHIPSLWRYSLAHKPFFLLVYRSETLVIVVLACLMLYTMATRSAGKFDLD